MLFFDSTISQGVPMNGKFDKKLTKYQTNILQLVCQMLNFTFFNLVEKRDIKIRTQWVFDEIDADKNKFSTFYFGIDSLLKDDNGSYIIKLDIYDDSYGLDLFKWEGTGLDLKNSLGRQLGEFYSEMSNKEFFKNIN